MTVRNALVTIVTVAWFTFFAVMFPVTPARRWVGDAIVAGVGFYTIYRLWERKR